MATQPACCSHDKLVSTSGVSPEGAACPPQMAATEVMTVEFFDDDLIGDEHLGSYTFDIGAELRKLPMDCRNAEWHQAFPLDKARIQ